VSALAALRQPAPKASSRAAVKAEAFFAALFMMNSMHLLKRGFAQHHVGVDASGDKIRTWPDMSIAEVQLFLLIDHCIRAKAIKITNATSYIYSIKPLYSGDLRKKLLALPRIDDANHRSLTRRPTAAVAIEQQRPSYNPSACRADHDWLRSGRQRRGIFAGQVLEDMRSDQSDGCSQTSMEAVPR
jgi:hypothetical protein